MNPYRELAIPHLPSRRSVEWCRRCVYGHVADVPGKAGMGSIMFCTSSQGAKELYYVVLVLEKCSGPTLKLAFQPRKR
jgi:hypothetical protein